MLKKIIPIVLLALLTAELALAGEPDPTAEVHLTATVENPSLVASLLECLDSDPNRVEVDYTHSATDGDDQRDIKVCIATQGHEDVGTCLRDKLLKLGAVEVQP